jgi:uncharacterized protein
MSLYPRNIATSLLESLQDTPVVLLVGARQTGKSTLVQSLSDVNASRYINLDDAALQTAAKDDPQGFLKGLTGRVIIDEIQRAPELFLAIKSEVDRNREPGRFLLTGSANVLLLPRLSESLVGRMEIHTLWGLSQGELNGVKEGFISSLFADTFDLSKIPPSQSLNKQQAAEIITRGGYPESIRRSAPRRQGFFGGYITTLLQRDIRDLAEIEGLSELPTLLSLLAARTSNLVNYSELSRSSALAQTTLKRYLRLFEASYLTTILPAWASNYSKRLVKSGKLVMCDTGLASFLIASDAIETSSLFGSLLESFVVMELQKQLGWSRIKPRLFHYRTHSGGEVDIVLERGQELVAIEVKAKVSLNNKDIAGLKAFAEDSGKRLKRGVILYLGDESVPFSDKLIALPLSSLWQVQGGSIPLS